MRHRLFIVTIIFTLSFGAAFGHQDFWIKKNYGNIKVRVKTGFKFEEINKAYIIGQLAEKLAKELNYSDTIFLDFKHNYTEDCKPAYFISYDKGKIEPVGEELTNATDYLKTNSIVLRQVSRRFNIISTLKLLEYAIKNVSSIKQTQKQIEYVQNYCEWKINTIDTNTIKKIIKNSSSQLVNNILKTRVDRPEQTGDSLRITYYVQNNMYTVYNTNTDKTITEILTLPYVYQILKTEFAGTLIFDSDSSFYTMDYNITDKSYKASIKYILDIKSMIYAFEPFTEDKLHSYFLEEKIKK